MSLVVWLPLNGSLENQGLSNITVTNNGATVDNNGKIGKCYSFDGSDDYIAIDGLTLGNTWSYGCWFSAPSSSRSWEGLIVLNNNGGDSDTQLGFYTYPGASRFQTTANGQYHASISYAYDSQWHHIFATFDGSSLKTYKDGILIDTLSISSSLLSRSKLTIGARCKGTYYDCYFNGKINDVRVYDHCLSAKEVKELAKGLVLHYRLAGPGQTNLLTDSLDLSKWENPYGKSELQSDGFYKATYTNVGWWGPRKAINLTAGKTYIASCIAKGTRAQLWIYHNVSGGNDLGSTIINTNNATKLTVVFTPAVTGSYYVVGYASNDGNTYFYKDMKLEEGSVATPWCPNPADALYSTMGYNNNIEYDCSGFGNNGTKSGAEMVWDINSPRYTTSYKFNGSGQKISVAKKIVPQLTDATFSVWFYRSDYGPQTHESLITILDDPINNVHNYFEIETKYSSTNDTRIWVYNGANAPVSKTNAYELNKWTHVAVTLNPTQIKLYVNGELVSTGTSHTLPDKANYWIGSYNGSQSFKGNISDVRIYVTELSAEDIAELYHSAVIIDNTGKSYAYEYFEAQ